MPLGGNHPIASLMQVQADLLVRGTAWMDFEIYKKILKQEVWCSRVVCLVNAYCNSKWSTWGLLQQTVGIEKIGGVIVIHWRGKSGCFLRGSSLSKYYFQPVDLVINFLISCLNTPKSERDPLLKIYGGSKQSFCFSRWYKDRTVHGRSQ